MAQSIPTESVSDIDRSTREFFSRDPDRPGRRGPVAKPPEATKRKRRRSKPAQPTEIVKAKSRRRIAAWRQQNDRLRRPEAARLGRAALDALLRSLTKLDDVSAQQHAVVARMLVELKAEGFDLKQVMLTMRARKTWLKSADGKNDKAGL